jgi:hypothetical protein
LTVLDHIVELGVVPHAADVAAAQSVNVIEELVLAEPAVGHVAVVRLEPRAEHVLLVALAAVDAPGDVDPRGHARIDREVGVQPPGGQGLAEAVLQVGRLGDRREGFYHRTVDRRQGVGELAAARVADLGDAAQELRDDRLQQRRIEDARRLRERSQRGPRAAQLPLHLLESAGLLQAAQRRDDRIE